jgi:hypothetical protein
LTSVLKCYILELETEAEEATMGRPPKKAGPDGSYRCSKCYRWKQPDQFYKNRNMSNGLTAQCKTCFKKYNEERLYSEAIKGNIAHLREMYQGAEQYQIEELATLHAKLEHAKNDQEWRDISFDIEAWTDRIDRRLPGKPYPLTSDIDPGSRRPDPMRHYVPKEHFSEDTPEPVEDEPEDTYVSPFYKPERWGPPTS